MTPCGIAIEKVWGTTTPRILTPMFELHELSIKAQHRCSMHVHRHKWNAFYIMGGVLHIDQPPFSFTVEAGKTFTIPPGVKHQFRTGNEGCFCLEMYYTETLSEDIIRDNVGGPVIDWKPATECFKCGDPKNYPNCVCGNLPE